MRITLDCERMKYPNTGIAVFCKMLATSLLNTLSDEDQLSLYMIKEKDHFLGENVKYIYGNAMDKFLHVSPKNMDIWHSTYQLTRYYTQNRHVKNLLTIHDLNYLYEKDDPTKIKIYTKEHQKRIDRADHIVAISEYTKKDILENLDIKDKPITVIHNGCSVAVYDGYDNPGYRPSNPFIFSIGTVLPKKNFHVLPALLVGNDYELIIAGLLSEYANKIIDQAKLYGVEKRVKILGPISDPDKYWYLKNCKAFMFPSLAEGFGFPAIEAMYFGKPVFLSTKTSLPEIGGNMAYYFHNFDASYMQHVFDESMNAFYADRHRAQLIEQHARQFNWESCAKKYYDIYNNLLL